MKPKYGAMVLLTGFLVVFAVLNTASAASYTVNNTSYGTYFNASGHIKESSNIHAGDVLDIYGTLYNKNMYIDRPLSVKSTSKTGKLVNGTITILKDGSGSNVTDLKIQNSNENGSGIFLYGTNNNNIQRNNIICNGAYGFGIALTRSNYNNITGNTVKTLKYVKSDGGTRAHTTIPIGSSNHNIISNNYVESQGANCIYLTIYSSGNFATDGPSYFNTISNNTVVGVDNSISYAIQMMGSNNTAINNTVKGAYRGISSELDNEGGNSIIGNNIQATYCGVYFTSNCTVAHNKITGSKSMSSGISAFGSNAKIVDNIINLSNGNGIYLAGSNCGVVFNNITTVTNEAVYVYGLVRNITLAGNIINSNSMGIVLKQQSSSKFPTGILISTNTITSKGVCAVNTFEGNKSVVIENYLISSTKQGNAAVVLRSGDTVTGNYGKFVVSADVSNCSYNKEIIVRLTASDHADPHPMIYYTLDGSTPNNGSTPNINSRLYCGAISINGKTTVLKFVGVDKKGNVSDVVTRVYTYDTNSPTVSVSVKSGRYNVSKVVSLKMSEAGTIYYTLNGSIPSLSSSKYVKSLVISSTKTLKYFAVDNAGNKSPVYTVSYVIDKIAPKVVSTTPKNGATAVSRSGSIVIRFSEHVTRSVNWSKVYLKNVNTGKSVSIRKLFKGNSLIIKNNQKLSANTKYKIYIPSSAIKDDAGNHMTKGYTINLKTGKN
ncbi:MAG: chitobiase/beta-hexosaminidase C-terminal domain-containing protein [Methanobacterium sp. ERen5]|nr:MAG: chitobiase/beta-hexosaminidase C-terminal domain-containing protein [Methanobacterium sp. ERen5]